jgi:hypothetical protein
MLTCFMSHLEEPSLALAVILVLPSNIAFLTLYRNSGIRVRMDLLQR